MTYFSAPGAKGYNAKKVDPTKILKLASEHFSIDVPDITGSRRNREFIIARMSSMYWMRSHTNLSLNQIGRLFGNRHHTTVINALNAINNQCETSQVMRNTIKDFTFFMSLNY